MRILTAAWVVPGDAPAVRDGYVAVSGDRIVSVGARDAAPTGILHDLGPGVLLPGLVNAHTHLELGGLAGRAPLGGFVPWVRGLVAARAAAERSALRECVRESLAALEACGTAAVGDVSNDLEHLDLLSESRLTAVVFLESLGWDPAAAAGVARRVDGLRARLPAGLAARDVHVRLAAHAPHSVSAELFAELERRGGVAALHLAESPDETRFLATGDGPWAEFLAERGMGGVPFGGTGLSPVRYAERLGVLRPGLLAAHCVHADDDDLARLAAAGVHVVVCPRSNAALGVGRAPVGRMLRAGITVALGTDSLASSPDLDVAREMPVLREAEPGLPAWQIVRMATSSGADALGLRDVGRLRPGCRAAVAFAAAPCAPADPFEFLVSSQARIRRLGPVPDGVGG